MTDLGYLLYTPNYFLTHILLTCAQVRTRTTGFMFFAVTSVTTQSFIALKTEPKIAFKRRIPVTKIGYKVNTGPNIYIKHSLITTYQ